MTEKWTYKQDPETKALFVFIGGEWAKLDHAIEPLTKHIEAMEQYLQHRPHCNKHYSETIAPVLQCTCGLDNVMKVLKEKND